MTKTNDVVVRELSEDLKPDYLRFFDQDAFADNPRWAGCYCHFYHASHDTQKWEERTGEENRAAVSELVARGEMSGYLAYLDGKVVGWCNANVKKKYGALIKPNTAGTENDRIGAIVCFTVAQPYRRRGVARELLKSACEGLKRRGVAIVEAYPRKVADSEAANYHGPLELYLRSGFVTVKEIDGVVTVRKALV